MDAYRVSLNVVDEEVPIDQLSMMIANKGIELATEAIPGCILQMYVLLTTFESLNAGTLYFSISSILISALTTGFTSAVISYDLDVDVPKRNVQARFYGYIPDDNTKRGQVRP